MYQMSFVTSTLEDNYNDIIQKAREGLGFSLRGLSDTIGISVQEMVRIEEGRGEIQERFGEVLCLSYPKLEKIYHKTYMPQKISEDIGNDLVLKQYEVDVGGFISNAYALGNKKSVLFIDAVGVSKEAAKYAQEFSSTPDTLLITHGHFDHTAGMETLKHMYKDMIVVEAGKGVLEDGVISVDGWKIQAFKTPGHTGDSVCYLVNDTVMFVGDTIFAGSVGRPNHSLNELLENIKTKIFTLPDHIILAPGHGPMTTIGEERENNPFF